MEKKVTGHDYDKYITIQKCNKLTLKTFAARVAEANLASKNDISVLVKKKDFDEKLKNLNKNVTSNKTKHALVENKLHKLLKKLKQCQQNN